MNTRFEVPLTLPPPHFDDERTVATARQVKPIGRARVTQSWRKLRTLLPLLFLATLCGAAGAAAVNYYERRQSSEVIQPPAAQANTAPAQSHPGPSPVAIAASTEVNGSKAVNENRTVEIEQPSAKDKDHSAVQEPAAPQSDNPVVAPKLQHKANDQDATKLTRKRRVQPVDEPSPRSQRNGAARISDIFSGPNP